MKMPFAGVIGAVLLLPVAAVLAQKASVRLPAQQRVITGPALSSAARNFGEQHQRLRAMERHMALVMADVRNVARGIREAAVGAAPALDSVGRVPARGTGRAGDRIGPGTGAGVAGSQYESPMGANMSDIDGRLRGNKPRSSVVGAGGIPDSRSVASTGGWVSNKSWGSDVMFGTTTTTRDPRSGATVLVVTTIYDAVTDRLTAWVVVTVDNMGNETAEVHGVDYRGSRHDTPVIVEGTTVRDGAGTVVTEKPATERPYEPGRDPPIDGPSADSQTAEEGTAGGMRNFNGPLGITCNPITGVCGPGLKLGSAQVNPGRVDGQSASVPRVHLDPRAPVVNPDPHALENPRTPTAIDRDGEGPGAIPPKP